MKWKFPYILVGAVITFIAISGVLIISIQSTAAQPNSASVVNAAQNTEEETTLSEPPIVSQETEEIASNPISANLINLSEDITVEQSEERDLDTAQKPETNIEAITEYVTNLTKTYEESVFGKSGWLYLQREEYIPLELRGNGEPAPGLTNADLHPNDITIHDTWFLIDEKGYYQQRVLHTRTEDGQILQRVVMANGRLTNLTIQAVDPNYEVSELQVVQDKLNLDYNLLYLLDIAAISKSEVNAWHEDSKYIVTITNWDEEPGPYMNTDMIIYGSQNKYEIDEKTGAVVSTELLLNDGEKWFIHTQNQMRAPELIEKLPDTAQQSLMTFINQ